MDLKNNGFYKPLYKIKYILTFIVLSSFMTLLFTGCTSETENNILMSQIVPASATIDTLLSITESESLFTAEDKEIGYDDTETSAINLNGDKVFSDSENVEVDGAVATIKSAGTYIVTGNLENGRIIVDAGSDEDIRLVLDGVNILNNTTSAIQIENANKVYITLAENTENKLSNNFYFSDNDGANGVIYSKSDITINGRGTLNVYASEGNGIVSEKNAVITGGTIYISADKYGIAASDSVRISSSMMSIESDEKGIYSYNEENDSLGFIYISDGMFAISSSGNAIDARSILLIDGGAFNISAVSPASSTENEKNGCGLIAGEEVSVSSGEFTFNTSDDAVYSKSNVSITGGSFTITSDSNGIYGENTVVIGEANIAIEKSYIGVQGHTVFVQDASLNITSDDDGINAAGGNDGSGLRETSSNSKDTSGVGIFSGFISINASGDGIDAKGEVSVSDGTIMISTADNEEDMVIDCRDDLYITGGTILATGNLSGEKNFSETEQQIITLNLDSQTQNTFIEILDQSGNLIFSDIAEQPFSNIILSSSLLQKGYTYTLKIGSYATTITI